jgi:peptidoglycan/LPS O-acetylase OafA/YrhL
MTSKNTIETEKPVLFTLRWIAAMFVAFGHAYSMIFHEYVGSSWSSSAGGLLEHIALIRSGAVIVFFVISGYLVGGSVLSSIENFQFRRYFINRFSRIYIVLLPALLLTGALDWTAYWVAPDNALYTTPALADSIGLEEGDSIFARYGAHQIVTSLVTLESIIGGPIGSNFALWSLGIEWFFYFILPAVLVVAIRFGIPRPFVPLAAAVVVAVLLTVIGLRWIATYWVIWAAGALCSQLRLDGPFTRFIPWTALVLALGMLIASVELSGLLTALGIPPRIGGSLMGICFALFLTSPRALSLSLSRTLDKKLADFSYSLYVTHEPVLIFAVLVFFKLKIIGLQGLTLSFAGLAVFLTATSATLIIGYIFGRLFESRTDQLKRYMLRVLPLRMPWAAPALHETKADLPARLGARSHPAPALEHADFR